MNKGLYIILAILIVVLIFLNFGFSNSFLNKISQIFFQNQNNIKNSEIQDCSVETEEMTVRGSSLDPFIKPEQIIKALFGYYDCNEVKRGDIVLFDYAGNKNFVIKIVKGISGDKFELKKAESGWNILINNQILKNSEDKSYLISGNAYKMLSLYERDYKGIIPENAYLLLGNQVSGSVDSTTFGLIDKSGIVAKVEI
ncbi:MAG: signal peptidase I [Parcubacteria group bacterium]|nr:signal peptidase I [Parcubacteria group bacterium]